MIQLWAPYWIFHEAQLNEQLFYQLFTQNHAQNQGQCHILQRLFCLIQGLFKAPFTLYRISNRYRRAASFLSGRGYYLHHAKAIWYEMLLKREGKSLRSVSDIQTGNYVVRAEDLPCAQRPIKRAEFEKYTCQAFRHLQKGAITYAEALRGWFSKRANLTGKNIFRAQKTNFPVWGDIKVTLHCCNSIRYTLPNRKPLLNGQLRWPIATW